MQEELQIDENSEKIEKIYQIIEFEIDNANNQISLLKKDNINFILLFLALIGFFAFIPVDVFFYRWFPDTLWIVFFMMLCVGVISIALPSYRKNLKKSDKDEQCESCDSSKICNNLDPERKEKIQKFSDTMLIENISLVYSAYIYTSFFFFVSCLLSYSFFTSSDSFFAHNSIIQGLLIFILALYLILILYEHPRILKIGNLKKYLRQMAIFSILIAVLTILIEIFGNYSKIPPFIPIENSTQFSSSLFLHSNIIPTFPLSLISTLYAGVIALVLLESLFSSRYIEKTNQKLNELFDLKYRIDRFELGISPSLDIKDILKQFPRLKIYPPDVHSFGGIFIIPIPLENNQCEEMLYLALEDSELSEIKNSLGEN